MFTWLNLKDLFVDDVNLTIQQHFSLLKCRYHPDLKIGNVSIIMAGSVHSYNPFPSIFLSLTRPLDKVKQTTCQS